MIIRNKIRAHVGDGGSCSIVKLVAYSLAAAIVVDAMVLACPSVLVFVVLFLFGG